MRLVGLINCKLCNEQISPNALACPKCGEPMKKVERTGNVEEEMNNRFAKALRICAVIFLVLVVIYGFIAGRDTNSLWVALGVWFGGATTGILLLNISEITELLHIGVYGKTRTEKQIEENETNEEQENNEN